MIFGTFALVVLACLMVCAFIDYAQDDDLAWQMGLAVFLFAAYVAFYVHVVVL